MSDNSPSVVRLSQTETNVLKLLRYAEGLADGVEGQPRRLGGSLAMPDEAVYALRMHRMAIPHRVAPHAAAPGMNQVHFTLDQLFRYVAYVCMRVGLTIHLDGSVTTNAGHTLSFDEIPHP